MVHVFFNLRGLVIKKFEGLLAADSYSDSIEAPILCQTRSHRFERLFRLFCQSFHLPVHFLIADLDFLQVRDPFQQQRRLHIVHCLLPLTSAKPRQVHLLQVFHLHALRGQSPQATLQTQIDLPVDQRLRHLKIIALHQFGHQLVFRRMLGRVALLGFHVLANLLANLHPGW